MKKALISPNESVSYISGWTDDKPPQPVFTQIPNSERVAEVADQSFEIGLPLFWLDCPDDIVADAWYYDNVTQQFVVTPTPVDPPQPTANGAQTL